MAGERTKLTVAVRERLGSRESRRLRRAGLVPGVLYGRGEPIAISVPERELRRALSGAGGLHALLDVEIDGAGKTHPSILKEYQVDPVRGGVTHIDLQEVRLDQPIHAVVTIHLVGAEDAPGIREGGVLSQPLHELNVEALPLKVPEHLDADVSALGIGGTLRVGDIHAPEGVTLLDDPDTVVATVTAPTRVVELEEAAEGVEAQEGEAAAGAAEAPAEPEAAPAGDENAAES